jgi:hypothetical protein
MTKDLECHTCHAAICGPDMRIGLLKVSFLKDAGLKNPRCLSCVANTNPGFVRVASAYAGTSAPRFIWLFVNEGESPAELGARMLDVLSNGIGGAVGTATSKLYNGLSKGTATLKQVSRAKTIQNAVSLQIEECKALMAQAPCFSMMTGNSSAGDARQCMVRFLSLGPDYSTGLSSVMRAMLLECAANSKFHSDMRNTQLDNMDSESRGFAAGHESWMARLRMPFFQSTIEQQCPWLVEQDDAVAALLMRDAYIMAILCMGTPYSLGQIADQVLARSGKCFYPLKFLIDWGGVIMQLWTVVPQLAETVARADGFFGPEDHIPGQFSRHFGVTSDTSRVKFLDPKFDSEQSHLLNTLHYMLLVQSPGGLSPAEVRVRTRVSKAGSSSRALKVHLTTPLHELLRGLKNNLGLPQASRDSENDEAGQKVRDSHQETSDDIYHFVLDNLIWDDSLNGSHTCSLDYSRLKVQLNVEDCCGFNVAQIDVCGTCSGSFVTCKPTKPQLYNSGFYKPLTTSFMSAIRQDYLNEHGYEMCTRSRDCRSACCNEHAYRYLLIGELGGASDFTSNVLLRASGWALSSNDTYFAGCESSVFRSKAFDCLEYLFQELPSLTRLRLSQATPAQRLDQFFEQCTGYSSEADPDHQQGHAPFEIRASFRGQMEQVTVHRRGCHSAVQFDDGSVRAAFVCLDVCTNPASMQVVSLVEFEEEAEVEEVEEGEEEEEEEEEEQEEGCASPSPAKKPKLCQPVLSFAVL